MKKVCKLWRWYYLLNKRLFKKVSFLLILAAVPILVVAMALVAKQDSGVLCIALCQENSEDEVSSAVVDKLVNDGGIIQYAVYDTVDEAYNSVLSGNSDAAWIFPDNMQEKINLFVTKNGKKSAVVRVIECEDNVFLQLAREKLFGALYSHLSYTLYSDFIKNDIAQGIEVSEVELEENYNITEVDGDFIEFSFMDSDESAYSAVDSNYLVTPIRGLLALMIMLCGLASAMYLTQDENLGNYVWLSSKVKLPFSYGYHMIAITDMALIVYVAILLSEVFTSWERELPIMILYCIATAGFCELIRKICGKIERLGIAIPLIMIIMLVLCPVFLNIRKVRILQYLLPPFYYLHAVHNVDFMKMMLIYIPVVYLLGFLIEKIKLKRA